ncbi:MAG: hypothetical protein ACRCZF_16535, partial [Gemmataceae bacterium]
IYGPIMTGPVMSSPPIFNNPVVVAPPSQPNSNELPYPQPIPPTNLPLSGTGVASFSGNGTPVVFPR